jgi:hypothetical protein
MTMNMLLLSCASMVLDKKVDLAVLEERIDSLTKLVYIVGAVALLALVLTAGKAVSRVRLTTKR